MTRFSCGIILAGALGLFAASTSAGELAFDKSGNLFIAPPNANAVLKIAPEGKVDTFAKGIDGPLAVDSAGNLFVGVADATGTIFKLAPDGARSSFATNVGVPFSLAFDNTGNLFVYDTSSGSIFKFDPSGNKSTFVQGKKPAGHMFADFVVLAFDRNGVLFAANTDQKTIWKFKPDGTRSTFATKISANDMAFDSSGNLIVGDFLETALFKIAPNGAKSEVKSHFNAPQGVALDSQNNLFVYDGPDNIVKVSPDGKTHEFAKAKVAESTTEESTSVAQNEESKQGEDEDTSAGLPGNYAKDYLIAQSTLSPDKKFAVIYPTKDDEEFPGGANYVVSLEPFAVLTKLETKQPYFKNESHGGLVADWSDDGSVALITLDAKWGPGDIFLAEFKNGKLTRTTNLLGKMHDLLLPDYKSAKAGRYNDYYDFVFESEEEAICQLDGAEKVQISALATTDPKGADEGRVWDGRLIATWDIAQGKFTSQKVVREFAGVRKHEE